jgi:hypothetical protein
VLFRSITNAQPQAEIEALRDVESTANALEIVPKEKQSEIYPDLKPDILGIPLSPLDLFNEGIITWEKNDPKSVAEAYHRAKADGSNTELVEAVENLFKQPETVTNEPQSIIEEQDIVEAKQQSDLQKELQIIEAPQKLIDAIPTDTTLREGFLSDTKNLSASLFGQAGVFDIAENAVKIGKFYSALFGGRDKILLHEAAHAATVTTMNDIIKNPNDYTEEQKQATEDIFNIYLDYSTNRTTTAKIFQPYGITNQYEFVAEFISNKKFRDFVAKNNPNDKVGFKELLWSKILEMLGMSKKEISTERIAKIEKAIDTTLDASIERNKKAKAVSLKTQEKTQKTQENKTEQLQPEQIEEVVVEPTTQGLSEAELPGYNRMINEVEGIVSKSKNRGVSEPKIADNVMNYVTGSKVYENATDVQREALVREVNKRFGIKEKAAPSANRILGKLKDITKITMSEKVALAKQIKDTARGAKQAVKAWKVASQELTKEIKELVSTGKVNAKQVALVLRKFSSVNVFDDNSVDRFVEYMSKVFGDAEYANKIDIARNKLSTARKNIATKLGIADGLMLPLQKLFNVNPTLIPDGSLNSYLELLDMFGEKKAVLSLSEKQSTIKKVQDILQAIDEEQSLADELADRFEYSENKVFDEDGKLDYSASIKAMLKADEITEQEADIMRKYKSDIVPALEKEKKSDEEIQKEKDNLIETLSSAEVSSNDLSIKDERNLAKEISKLIKTDGVKQLTNTELKNLLKVIENINNGYMPHYAQLIVEKINAANNSEVLQKSVEVAKPTFISNFYSKIKSLITRKGAIDEMIRRNPLFYIDQLFGNFKSKDIFNAIFNKSAEAESLFKADLKKVQNILDTAEEKVAKSFKLDPNKTLMSKFKMMTYLVQLEYVSNEGNKQVNKASDYLKATIKHIDEGKSQYGERDAEMLQEIYDEFTNSDGDIDIDKLYNSFNKAEKNAIKDIREVNESLKEKAEYTAAVIRGQKINPLTNYVHLNVLHESKPNDLVDGTSFVESYNQSLKPSTKAKSLIERTGKVAPLNFDVFASAQRGAKFTLMDYHLTEPIRTARRTINQTISNMEKNGRIPKQQRQILNAINSAFEETLSNLLENSYVASSFADDVANNINKQGYRAILAGTGRFLSEFSSNVGFALFSDPSAFNTGIKNRKIILSTDAPLIMDNVKSKQTTRIFPTDTLAGKLIDTNILNQATGIKGGKSKNYVTNKIQQIWNLSGKKYKNSVELISDVLISTPDKAIMRPLWFGSFANTFQKETGIEVDYDKIAKNDEAYMDKYKDAIEKSKTIADERSVMTGATDNPFMGILKGTNKPNQNAFLKAFNNFNGFMTRFLIFEYVTARTGIMAAIGNGSLTKKQGAAVLAGVTTRMMLYTLLSQAMGSGLIGLFFDDDEEEDDTTLIQKIGKSFASATTSMILGRDFGNATKLIVNYGIEKINEEYLDFLREGDYDPYKDAIQYSLIPQGKKAQQTEFSDLLMKIGGAFGPALNTTELLIRKATEAPKTKADAIERSEAEVNVRIPMEIAGNLGYIPMYKDVRKAVLNDMYKDLKNAEANAENKKRIEQEKLHGYKNREELKRYAPELYEQSFGEGSPGYDAADAKRKLKREKDSIERALKDELYNYQPRDRKRKKGFGSAGFGESPKRKSKKSSGGFGSAGFGG